MDLNKLAEKLTKEPDSLTILIHGDPGCGKTALAATISKLPWIQNVYYLGLDNGHDTLVTMLRKNKLTAEHAKKFKIIRIQDTPDLPLGYETTFKLLTVPKEQQVCIEHGRVDCATCKKEGKDFQKFDVTKLGKNDAVIVDTLSQLADSMLNYYCKGKGLDYKPGWDEFGPVGKNLAAVLTLIQAGKTNWVCVTQSIGINLTPGTTDQIAKPEDKAFIEKTYPLCGSQPNSMRTAKYFRHKIYCEVKLGKFKAGSTPTYRTNTIASSGLGWEMEKLAEPDFSLLYLPKPNGG